MATTRPFAYNTGAPIPGTEQIGNLAIGFPTNGFESTGLQWWNGADEELGYVICVPVLSGTHPTPIPGVFSYISFIRSSELTEQSFVDLVNSRYNQNLTSGDEAKIWLNNNGYWTSYTSSNSGYSGTSGSSGTSTTLYWNAGSPYNNSGDFAISANNTNNLNIVTEFYFNKISSNSSGNISGNVSSFLSSLQVGTQLTIKNLNFPSNTGTYEVTSVANYGPDAYKVNVNVITATGISGPYIFEFIFQ